MQPHLLPVVGSQRPGPVPDRDGRRDPPEVVHVRRAADGGHAVVVEVAAPRGGLSEGGHARRVPCEVGRGEVGEVADRG